MKRSRFLSIVKLVKFIIGDGFNYKNFIFKFPIITSFKQQQKTAALEGKSEVFHGTELNYIGCFTPGAELIN